MNWFKMPVSSAQKQQVAARIALLFHIVGFVGIIFINESFFVPLTPVNLILSTGLLIWTQPGKNRSFYVFVLICFTSGMLAEWMGVNRQWLFGHYQYGEILGPKLDGVPFLIGINWFVIVLCSGVTIQTLLNLIWNKLRKEDLPPRNNVGFWSFIIDGALMATAFDWLMEPVAVRLGFWTWLDDGRIPMYNYLCWYIISGVLLLILRRMPILRENQFAVHLLLIQSIFFLALRTVLL